MDLEKHEVKRDGIVLSLTAKEFSLLELFIMNPEKVLSREYITEHVWDMNFDPRSNVIESYMKFLRQRIDKGFSSKLIKTVRGVGYKFTNKG